jgi:Tol biopolymer transport system component
MIGVVRRPFAAVGVGLLTACLVALLAAPRADAGYPGKLGVIAVDGDVGLPVSNDEIFTFPSTGGPPFTQLTFDVLGNVEDDESASYSGDGKRIAWEGDTDVVGGGDNEIFIMNADGSGQTQLTPTSDTGDDADDPAISWDGKRIVFEFPNPSGGDDEIWIMNADGSGQTPLTSNDVGDGEPVFSRDGKRIFFESDDADGDNQIFVMNADGSGQRQLTNIAAGFSGAPDVSPDDRRIVFTSDRLDPGLTADIWVMNADGSGQAKLSSLPSGDNAIRPVYSPDGKRILFDYSPGAGGGDEIYAINATDGSGLVPLTSTPGGSVDDADWQPIPVSCGGQMSTLVGTEGPDTITGTSAADVIAGLGGKDKLSGLQGKDRLCGGKGKDKLKGGAGNDRLFGQAGKDKLKAGKGKKDKCVGGKGKDTGAGCEKEKSI